MTDQQIIRGTFVISGFFILVYEDNTYNLLVQRSYFQEQSHITFLQKRVCKYAAKLQDEIHTKMRFQKTLRSTSAWVLYCRFAVDFPNTFSEEHLWGTAFVFHIICYGASNK